MVEWIIGPWFQESVAENENWLQALRFPTTTQCSREN